MLFNKGIDIWNDLKSELKSQSTLQLYFQNVRAD